LEILLRIVFTKFMIYSFEEISDFQLCCRRFIAKEISTYFLRNKIGQPTKVKPFLCPTTHEREWAGGLVLEGEW
jgi:hypothetical protein